MKLQLQALIMCVSNKSILWVSDLWLLSLPLYYRPIRLSKDHGEKWKFLCKTLSNFKIFWYIRVICIKRKLRTCTIQIQKEKVWFFEKKYFFWNFWFFSKGGTLWWRNRRKNFFPFFKNFENKPQKWLSWDHSNINRNKVMNFGGRSSYPAETARPFTVVRAIMAPPRPE